MSRYVVIDLEMCRMPKGMKKSQTPLRNEIIEIGAVLLDESLEIADTFKSYVSPRFLKLDSYIENLTGITEKDLQNAPYFKDTIESFVGWLPEDAILVSWSESDEHQIRKEVTVNGVDSPKLCKMLDEWVDCQKTFSEKMDSPKVYRLSEALAITDIAYEDGAHDALVDAKNTAQLFAKMKREKKLRLNSYYLAEDSSQSSVFNPFAELLANFKVTA